TTLGQNSRRSSAPRSRQRLETAHPSERVRHSAQQSSQQKRWSKRRSRSGTNDPSSRSSELFGSNGLRQQRQCSHVAHPKRLANLGVKARSDEHAEQEARRTTWHAHIVHEGIGNSLLAVRLQQCGVVDTEFLREPSCDLIKPRHRLIGPLRNEVIEQE